VNPYDVLKVEYSLAKCVCCVVEGNTCNLVSYLYKMYKYETNVRI